MEITRTPLPIGPAPAPGPGGAGLKLGDVVTAVVRARLSDTNLLLQIGGKTLVAATTADLPPGTLLKLEVTRPGTTPELRPLAIAPPGAHPGGASPSPPSPADTPEAQALRLLLPKQIPLAEFAAALPKLADPAHPLPAPVKQALAGLLAALPNPGRLATAEGLAQALGDAGIWFEARLARVLDRGGDFPAGDFKGLLLTVLDRLDAAQPATGAPAHPAETAGRPANTPETAQTTGTDPSPLDALARKVEGALARIGLDQLAALPQPDGTQSWSVAIPYAQGEQSDTLRIRIDAEAQHGGAEATATQHWSVNLELRPPGLGTVSARLVLAGGKIDTYLWSDTADTAGLLRDHGDWLRARLEGAGLAVGHLDTLAQAPAANARNTAPAAPLLDLKA
ncbi:flagellar hook-length control protein FliK [Methylomagnum ishizawai]|uniref:flagellar hook-length control protein FliK n=1 Tax=Methylomagnum ishizawai TaxID=1760988 RepID=UPI001C341CC7|nr:flagellar hook-length control protein FliK [Methylomagnum ishizawai]BBL73804.1 hypothetical protein MishRS11D_09020 [Methylomagnum ishizawai]